MKTVPMETTDLSAAEVERFLREQPGFLRDRPELYRALEPPRRVHGDRLADHMAALLDAERGHATAMSERADNVLAAGRAAASLAARVQEAVLALIRSDDAADCIVSELPSLLGIDGAALCMEVAISGTRTLPTGMVDALMRGRNVLFRQGGLDAHLLHGEAALLARYEALVRVPGEGPMALLALVTRKAGALDPTQGSGALSFLGRVVAAALGR